MPELRILSLVLKWSESIFFRYQLCGGESISVYFLFTNMRTILHTVQYIHLHYERYCILLLCWRLKQFKIHVTKTVCKEARRITDKQHVEADEKAWIYKIRAIPYIIICKFFWPFHIHIVQWYQPLLLYTSSVVDHILVGSDPESGSDPTRIWSWSCF